MRVAYGAAAHNLLPALPALSDRPLVLSGGGDGDCDQVLALGDDGDNEKCLLGAVGKRKLTVFSI